MNLATQEANAALEGRGYLVVGYRPWRDRMPSVGEILDSADHGQIDGPLRVIAQTTYDDLIEQAMFWGYPSSAVSKELKFSGVEFFRLVAE